MSSRTPKAGSPDFQTAEQEWLEARTRDFRDLVTRKHGVTLLLASPAQRSTLHAVLRAQAYRVAKYTGRSLMDIWQLMDSSYLEVLADEYASFLDPGPAYMPERDATILDPCTVPLADLARASCLLSYLAQQALGRNDTVFAGDCNRTAALFTEYLTLSAATRAIAFPITEEAIFCRVPAALLTQTAFSLLEALHHVAEHNYDFDGTPTQAQELLDEMREAAEELLLWLPTLPTIPDTLIAAA